MNKTEFFEVVKAAGIEPGAVENLEIDGDGQVEEATIEIQNEALLPQEIAPEYCGRGWFYSRVCYRLGGGEPWTAEAGYIWNDSMTTAGDEPACDPAPSFTTLQEAAGYAACDAEDMAENLQRDVDFALEDAGGQPIENYNPNGWRVDARFDLTPVTEDAE